MLEDYGAVAGGFLALCGATADERWLARRHRPARRRAHPLPGRRRRLLRHPCRRRAAGRPAARPGRQRQPVGHLGHDPRTARGPRAHRRRAMARRGRRGAGGRVRAGAARTPLRRLVPGGRPVSRRRGAGDRGGRSCAALTRDDLERQARRLAGCRGRRRGGPERHGVLLLDGPRSGRRRHPRRTSVVATFVTVRCYRLAKSLHPLDADLVCSRPRPGGSGEPERGSALGGHSRGRCAPTWGRRGPARRQAARRRRRTDRRLRARRRRRPRGHDQPRRRRRVARGHDRGRRAVVRARRRAPLAPLRPRPPASPTPSSSGGSTPPSGARCPTSRCRPTCPRPRSTSPTTSAC